MSSLELSRPVDATVLMENAFEINGVVFKYSLPRKGKGAGSWRTKLTTGFLSQLNNKKKEHRPVLDLWSPLRMDSNINDGIRYEEGLPIVSSKNNMVLLVADFDGCDELPPWSFDSWCDHRSYIDREYGHLGMVLRSPSGKTKIVFKVKVNVMNLDMALRFLKSILNHLDYIQIDNSLSANSQLFLNETMYMEAFYSGNLDRFPIHSLDERSVLELDQSKEIRQPKIKEPWRFYEGDLEDLRLTSVHEITLARFILGSSKRALTVIDLPQPHIRDEAKLIGLETSQRALSVTIQSFVQKGWLELVDSGYLSGHRGKQYKVAGKLKEVAEKILSQLLHKEWTAPTQINSGEWHQVMLQSVNHFTIESKWEDWFYSIPGCGEKDREQQMKNIWKLHLRGLARSQQNTRLEYEK